MMGFSRSLLQQATRVTLMALCLFSFQPAYAGGHPINDSVALNGLKEVKIVYLIDFPHPQRTDGYLKDIEATRQGYLKQGVEPKMVLVFQGETVKYLTRNPDEMLVFEYEKELNSIAETIARFKGYGVRMEICSVATAYFKVDNQTVLPGMTVVGDSSISMVGWQYQGYKAVY
ncbi:DsrE family protein [Thiomicrorhabdus sp.]|uniref:DsrE family protein n=1 Tax=Thiomicrorhabdus sp. TaxID=2039724 RepID=UPI0029C6E4A1|nr:DsrE family protein [Thiomicrorhabdus sp.]